MRSKSAAFILIIICFMLFQSSVWAEVNITLDGSFSDWGDKPALSDAVGDGSYGKDIQEVRWYPDNTREYLYLYSQRSESGYSDWSYSVYLTGDLGERRADIYYKRANSTVTVNLYDLYNRRIWTASGRWGDGKNTGTRVEFYVPLSQLVSTTGGGYEIDAYFKSSADLAPDDGVITISSVSSGPVYIVAGAIITNVFLIFYLRRKKVRV